MTWFCGQETPGNMKMLKEKKKRVLQIVAKECQQPDFCSLVRATILTFKVIAL